MLQTGLAAAFGFCAALFLVLLLAPAIARRVSELTWRQATRVLPQSSEEIAAARDHLRGQNAVEMRQLEMKMEAVAEKERQLSIGKQSFEDRISSLSAQTEQLNGSITKLEGANLKLSNQLSAAAQTNALLSTENADRDVRLATLSSEFSLLRNDHVRQVAAFGLMEEAHNQMQSRFETTRNEASTLRTKVSTAESELRMARTDAKRHEGDAKLANRKITALEGKLERSIRLMAEAEEKLERREAELKRYKEQGRSVTAHGVAVKQSAPAAIAVISRVPEFVVVSKEIPKQSAIVAKIAELRPALRAAKTANLIEKSRLKVEMMDVAGHVTAEAALHSPELRAKIAQLRPGESALADAILKHNKVAAE